MLIFCAAIGHSTNLIGRDDNIIIVRDGGADASKTVYVQMQTALERFFPAVEVPDTMLPDPGLSKDDSGNDLRRINTGVSSLVGQDNGQRPGGFVLVIDGGALGYVCCILTFVFFFGLSRLVPRLWEMTHTSNCCCVLQRNAMLLFAVASLHCRRLLSSSWSKMVSVA